MPSTNKQQRICLYDTAELDSVLDLMTRQVAALMPAEDSALVGILRRGEPLARMLQQRLGQLPGYRELPLYPLKVKRYGDDLSLLHAQTQLTESAELARLDLANIRLLVVDDVLYQGHSLLRTCAYLTQLGARELRCAVLVDRGVCSLPVHADVVGLRLQVAADDVVECNVPPYEEQFRIDVLRQGIAR